jgi:UDP-N-acetylglucosamine 2-epimerase (non-hydrolysing)/GDP/UDP-N,N'-diacetylbacillosamine 2-epimerase (hydrolysing)
MRTICVLTGTRAEYGLLKPTLKRIQSDESLTLQTIVTGTHLSPRHGETVSELQNDGIPVDERVRILMEGDGRVQMIKSLGLGVLGFSEALDRLDPDILLVLGDRVEVLAGAMTAAYMYIPVAHVHGGDAGAGVGIDDLARHAVTKFSHIHFPASDRSHERIRRLGEPEWRITTVGAPGLDAILAGDFADETELSPKYPVSANKNLLLVLFHPETMHPDAAGAQYRSLIEAIKPIDAEKIFIYPNADPGSEQIIEELESLQGEPSVHVFENIPRNEYLGLMSIADVMVGNSSSGIIEAPSLGLPFVEVGQRQTDRERGKNVISVGFEPGEIYDKVEKSLHDETVRARIESSHNPYDKGGCAENIVTRLKNVELGDAVLQKPLDYEI